MSIVVRFNTPSSCSEENPGSQRVCAGGMPACPWDERASLVRAADVSSEALVFAYRFAVSAGTVGMSAFDPDSFLANLGLTRGVFLTNAGAVMFSGCEESSVSCCCFASSDHSSFVDARLCAGSFPVLLEESVAFMLRHKELAFGASLLHDRRSVRRYRIVFEEIVTNALIHRSYEESGAVRVVAEPGRIVVSNPIASDASGRRFPFSLQRDEIVCKERWVLEHAAGELSSLDGNVALKQAAQRLGLARMTGTGLLRAASLCRMLGLEFEVGASSEGAYAAVFLR